MLAWNLDKFTPMQASHKELTGRDVACNVSTKLAFLTMLVYLILQFFSFSFFNYLLKRYCMNPLILAVLLIFLILIVFLERFSLAPEPWKQALFLFLPFISLLFSGGTYFLIFYFPENSAPPFLHIFCLWVIFFMFFWIKKRAQENAPKFPSHS